MKIEYFHLPLGNLTIAFGHIWLQSSKNKQRKRYPIEKCQTIQLHNIFTAIRIEHCGRHLEMNKDTWFC